MEEIDKKIKAYYQSKSLTPKQLSSIVNGNAPKAGGGWKRIINYAAIFLFFVSTSLLVFYTYNSKHKLLNKYAEEVAFNHLKDLKSDIQTDDIEDLNSRMQKLNFALYLPTSIQRKYDLLGGRYCSLDKRLAAQLKLREKATDTVATLYVLDKYDNEEFDTQLVVDSTSISIWSDESNLFVLAL